MSEEENKTAIDYIDKIATLIEVMMLAHAVKDDKKFGESYRKASALCFEANLELYSAEQAPE